MNIYISESSALIIMIFSGFMSITLYLILTVVSLLVILDNIRVHKKWSYMVIPLSFIIGVGYMLFTRIYTNDVYLKYLDLIKDPSEVWKVILTSAGGVISVLICTYKLKNYDYSKSHKNQ